MPAKTPKQARFMSGCAKNPAGMKGKCPAPKVAREFHAADRGRGKVPAPPPKVGYESLGRRKKR